MIFDNRYIISSLLSLVVLVGTASCNTEEVDPNYGGGDEPYVHGELKVLEDADFPYTITDDIELTVDVNTLTGGVTMDNKKLGINSTLKDAYVGAKGYDAENSKNFISYFQPTVMRFPNGVYGNFYNWKDDNRYLPTYTGLPKSAQTVNTTQPNWYYGDHASAGQQGYITLGVEGLVELQKSLKYDILWIWCMNHVDGTMEKLVSTKTTEDSFFEGRDASDVLFYKGYDGKFYNFKQALEVETKARYKYYTETLYSKVDYVELGNEQFFKSQQSALSSSVKQSEWSAAMTAGTSLDETVVRTISETLKELNPNIKLAVPYSWRRGTGNSVSADSRDHYKYNKQYKDNLSDCYDAMVLHKYVKPKGYTASNFKTLMQVRRDYQADFEYYQWMEPGKEVWMTEWSIGITNSDNDDDPSQEEDEDTDLASAASSNAVSVLSLVDLYFYLFSEPLFTHIEYFQAHGSANPFFINSGASNALVLTKTGFGAAHEILRGMFQSSTLLPTQLDGAPMLIDETKDFGGAHGKYDLDAVYGVSAQAVKQANGHYALLLVNKTNREASLKIKFDGEDYAKDYIYEYLSFNSLRQERKWSQTANVLTMQPYRDGDLILKPYSITKISEFRLPDAPAPEY